MPWKKWLILPCVDFILLNPSLDLPMWLLCACRLVSLIERVQPSIFLVSYNQYIAPKKEILTNLWWLMFSVGARIPTTHVWGGAGTSPFSAKIELEPERGSKCISADRWWLLILRKPVLGQKWRSHTSLPSGEEDKCTYVSLSYKDEANQGHSLE